MTKDAVKDFSKQIEDLGKRIESGVEGLPVEVKAEGNVRANSLTALLAKNPDLEAVRFSMLPYKEQGQLKCVPLYAV